MLNSTFEDAEQCPLDAACVRPDTLDEHTLNFQTLSPPCKFRQL